MKLIIIHIHLLFYGSESYWNILKFSPVTKSRTYFYEATLAMRILLSKNDYIITVSYYLLTVKLLMFTHIGMSFLGEFLCIRCEQSWKNYWKETFSDHNYSRPTEARVCWIEDRVACNGADVTFGEKKACVSHYQNCINWQQTKITPLLLA